ncbi:hypothetical protein C8Q75DRAFT_896252 [Abortiporus biennis]|nr:hypothetical protein C8Q75DRAFT_896252 [Abortiporus biennis]
MPSAQERATHHNVNYAAVPYLTPNSARSLKITRSTLSVTESESKRGYSCADRLFEFDDDIVPVPVYGSTGELCITYQYKDPEIPLGKKKILLSRRKHREISGTHKINRKSGKWEIVGAQHQALCPTLKFGPLKKEPMREPAGQQSRFPELLTLKARAERERNEWNMNGGA